MTGYIQPAAHEFAANFPFNEYGLDPLFALARDVVDDLFDDRCERYPESSSEGVPHH